MKSWILIVSYLWKDTWSRWLEQPSSVLARLFVGGLLAAAATSILVAFTLVERGIRSRLESFGVHTLVVRELISPSDPEMIVGGTRPDRLSPLSGMGQKLRLRQLLLRAKTEWQDELNVFSYSMDGLSILSTLLAADTPLICLSENWPENARIHVSLNRQSAVAVVRRPQPFARGLGTDSALLAPQNWFRETERLGYVEVTLFHRKDGTLPMEDYVRVIPLLYALDRRQPPQIQTSLGLLQELERLQDRQKKWRGLLAGLLGLTLALVYGALAILEFRQNQFVAALLRSFGAPSACLYARHLLESILICNAAALGAITVISALHYPVFTALGFPGVLVDFAAGNPYWSGETGWILLGVNLGALLSSLPIAAGLRRPIGEILG